MRWWKWVGLAGVVGVAATGVVVARSERRRRAYTPDEVRTRLHLRVAQAGSSVPLDAVAGSPAAPGRARAVVRRFRPLSRLRSRRDAR